MCEGLSLIKHLVNTDCNYEQLSEQYEVKSVRDKVNCEGLSPKYVAINTEDIGKFPKLWTGRLRHQ